MVPEIQLEKSRVEALVGESVANFSVSAGCKDGDGMAGSLRSISVTTTTGKELHLVLKDIDINSPWGGASSVENGSFKVENMVYSALIPKLTELAKSRGVDAQIPVPHVHDCYKGENPVDDYICMEDVRFQGYKMTDKYAGLTLEETLLVMKEIGRFHALTFALIKYEGEKIFAAPPFSTLVKYFGLYEDNNPEIINPKLFRYAALWQGAIKNGLELMETRNPPLYQKMKTHFEKTGAAEKFPQFQLGTAFGTDLKYFPVISHGDLWSNNILFKYNNEGIPISIKFLDFQFSRRGNIYEDLTYFLYTSTTPEFRRNHPLSPLKTYFDSFTGMLKELKMIQPIGFTFGTFLDSFNENIPCVYRYMMFAIPLQLGTSLPEVMGMMQQGKQNGEPPGPPPKLSPEEQLQIFMAMMKIQMETSERAMERLIKITQEMADLNVI